LKEKDTQQQHYLPANGSATPQDHGSHPVTPSSAHTTQPLRSALKKHSRPAEGGHGNAALQAQSDTPPPSYAQGTMSSLKRQLRLQRLSAEAAQKENADVPTSRAATTAKLWQSLQLYVFATPTTHAHLTSLTGLTGH
jgi:hypothetical protein